MKHLVASHNPHRQHLAQYLLKSFAAVLVAAASLSGNAFAAGSNSVSLAWDPNPETNVAGYRLQYGMTSGVYPSVVDAGAATSATATGLNQGTTYYFTVVAYNTAGQSSPASSEIAYTVPGTPNTAPAATSFSATVAEDGQVTVTLSGSDAEGDGLAYSIVSSPTKGSLTGTAPNLTYRPAANANGSDSFTYRVNDGALDSATATVSITITPVNDAPVADAKSATVQEDGEVAITLSGSDLDGNSLTYSIVTSPAKGTLTGTAPNFTYRPAANANGSDSFTYRVNDGAVNSATATVSITISPVNDVPVANSGSATTNEDTAVGITLSGSDVEGSNLTYSIVGQPSKGGLSGTPPSVTYRPNANTNGADSFTFRVNDGSANSATATVSINIVPVNDVPVANAASASTTPDTAVAITVSGSDAEGSSLTYAIVTQATNGIVSGTGPAYTYTPNSGFNGADSFTYRVNDGTANSTPATVTISVGTSNRKPLAHPKTLAIMKDKTAAVTLTGFDGDGQALSYRLVSQPANGTVSGSPPNLVYKPNAKWTGEDQFTYVANDGIVDSNAATVRVRVKAKNVKPVATPQSVQGNQNSSVVIVLSGSDTDGDPLSFAVGKAPKKGGIVISGNVATYTPSQGFKGKDSFTFAAHDGTAKSAPAAVQINVVNPNNKAPVAIAKIYSGPAKKVVAIELQGTDADSDALAFRVVSPPASGKLTGKGTKLKFKPAATFSGTVSFTYVANDGVIDSAPATVSITIAAPVAARSVAAKSKSLGGEGAAAAAPRLFISPSAPGKLVLTVTGTPGERYVLEHSADLTEWLDSQSVDVAGTGVTELEVAIPPGAGSGFFRLRTP